MSSNQQKVVSENNPQARQKPEDLAFGKQILRKQVHQETMRFLRFENCSDFQNLKKQFKKKIECIHWTFNM